MLNRNWIRWVKASVNWHFTNLQKDVVAAAQRIPLYIEGDERDTNDLADFAELRMDGPNIRQVQKDLYYLESEINVLIQSHLDPKDLYKVERSIGIFSLGFVMIDIFKFGDGVQDDGRHLGCMKLLKTLDEDIEVANFGIIRQDTRLMQSTIEGHYRLELST